MRAVFSPDRLYRYRLDRDIGMFGPPVGFTLHNPSTADDSADDPTSTRGTNYAKAWCCSRLIYVNPWAGIATRKPDLWKMADPVGPDNDFHIEAVAREIADGGGFMVAAWGDVSPPARLRDTVRMRLKAVETILRDCGCDIRALGVTGTGAPRHPLYMRSDAVPVAWPANTGQSDA